MEITDLTLQKKNKSRVNISLDGEFKGVLFDEIVFANGLKVGDFLKKEQFERMLSDSQNYFAKTDAFKFISSGFKTEKELRNYLYKKGYIKAAVDYAVALVKEYDLIDDRKYCEEYYRIYRESKSIFAIKSSLKQKGINDSLINEIVVDEGDTELRLAEKLTEKFIKSDDKNITFKALMKLKRQLYSRGITLENIEKATSDFTVINENNDYGEID